MILFFFKQKTAYEMRISDWSSDVCSSDLVDGENAAFHQDAVVKPLREGDAHAADVAGAILELAVAVDPGEGGLDRVTRADVGLDRRRLQTVEGIAQQIIGSPADLAFERPEQIGRAHV